MLSKRIKCNIVLMEQAHLNDHIKDNQHSTIEWLELTEKFLDTAYEAKSVFNGDNAAAKKKLLITMGENLIIRDKR